MLKISQQTTIKLIVAINTLANLHFFISRPCLSPSPRLSTPATFPGTLPRAKERRTVAFLLLRKTARAVVRSARRTLFAPRFRSRSIVAPAHKPATIFSDQSPRDEHECLREVRVRPEGNGAEKAATFVAAFFGAPSGTLPRSKNAPLGRFCPPDRRRARAVLVARWCTRLNLL